MNLDNVIRRIQHAADSATVDAESNEFARLAYRLNEQGSSFSAPLTKGELRLLNRFLDIEK